MLGLILVLISSCYEESDFNRVNFTFDSLIKSMDIEKTMLLADGKDESEIIILFDSNSENDTIDFKATLTSGLFKENQNDSISLEPILETSITGTRRKLVRFSIVSPTKVEEAELNMDLNGFTKMVDLQFDRSFPESIEVIASPRVFSRKRVENVELKTTIARNEGEPSLGTELSMTALDLDGNSIGEMVAACNFNSDNKTCTTLFNIWPDTAYLGPIRIRTEVLGAPSDITNEITIFTTD